MEYISLNKQEFRINDFRIVPIRIADKYQIMQWRNEQLYHLRQSEPLTISNQDKYFDEIITPNFLENFPDQILFSYLHNEICIGYGGLVHINRIDKNAEISFLIDTELEKNHFNQHWTNFLKMIEIVAFEELNFHKIYVYAFDLRPHLYDVLEENSYFMDAKLKDHCYFNGKFIDVVIYSKIL